MKIRIKSTPPGEAPEHVRQAWIGLELPVPLRCRSSPGIWSWCSFWSEESVWALFSLIFRRAKPTVGYIVESHVAIDVLATRSPEAAAWWRQNTPQYTKPGRNFIFAAELYEELHEGGS
jgi:hypothetical protein